MATVIKKKDETTEMLLRRFKKSVQRDGVMEELRKREYYLSPSQKKKEKHKRAMKREKKY